MLLRTLVGSRAGQIEDYGLEVARAALANGHAVRLDAPAPPLTTAASASAPTPVMVPAKGSKPSGGKPGKRSGR